MWETTIIVVTIARWLIGQQCFVFIPPRRPRCNFKEVLYDLFFPPKGNYQFIIGWDFETLKAYIIIYNTISWYVVWSYIKINKSSYIRAYISKDEGNHRNPIIVIIIERHFSNASLWLHITVKSASRWWLSNFVLYLCDLYQIVCKNIKVIHRFSAQTI